jgi:hypothetical protein
MVTALTGVLVDGTVGTNAPTAQPLTFEQGEACTLDVTVINTAGSAADLTGGQLVLTARIASSVPAVLSLTATIDNAVAGMAHFSLPSSATSGVAPYPYRYDVAFIDGSGSIRHVLPVSILNITPSVYRAS